ncbi:hypothetical protein GCM10027058_20560 [Microbacterium neimengense]
MLGLVSLIFLVFAPTNMVFNEYGLSLILVYLSALVLLPSSTRTS